MSSFIVCQKTLAIFSQEYYGMFILFWELFQKLNECAMLKFSFFLSFPKLLITQREREREVHGEL
jgi:EamA domain-containing membrane protein RarD